MQEILIYSVLTEKVVVLTEALANYDCGFTLNIDGKDLVKTSGKGIKNCIFELFGQNTLKNLKEFPLGYAGNLNILRSNRESIYTYINGRYVKSAIIEKAVTDSYYTKLMKGRYPFAIIFLEIDPKEIDVNVHPSKKIVKFSNETRIYSYVKQKMDEVLALEEREDLPVFVDFAEGKIANTEDVLEKIYLLYKMIFILKIMKIKWRKTLFLREKLSIILTRKKFYL